MRTSRRSDIDSFLVMDMVEEAARLEARGQRIIHMEIGQPGTPAPRLARQAVARALDGGALGYTPSLGLPDLRRKIADLYARRHGLHLDPSRVIVTAGASGAFVLAFSMLFDPGDRVALGAPGYPAYRQILKAQGITPVAIPTSADHRFQPRPDDLPDDIAGLILASPSNPAGTMLDRAALGALATAASANGAALISDEIYHGLEYDRPAVTALEVSDDAIVVNSFSKYWSMTGWRIGWMIVPEPMVRVAERLQQNLFICAPHVAQVAALAALDAEEECQANLSVHARNRARMIEGLPKAGLSRFAPPDGAFYVYADVSALCDDSLGLARDILREVGVCTTSGRDFDADQGHRWLRLSYCAAPDDIDEGLARLQSFARSRGWVS